MFWIYDILILLFLLSLFTVIPGVSALILCVKFPKATPKLFAVVATVLAIFSLITLGNPVVFYYSMLLLSATAPILYCVAFLNKRRKIYITLIPSALFFIYYFVQYCVSLGFFKAVQYLIIGFPGDQSQLVTFMSVIFILWGLFCIFITRGIYKFFECRNSKTGNKGV